MKPVTEPSPGDLSDIGIEPRSPALQETSLVAQMVKNLPTLTEKSEKCKLLSHARLFVTPWTVAHQAPLSMEFSRQEY